ncbi:MAG: outer membrane protein transport protein [Deltaproteobacteria bacterium]|nr:outer membrane protein transport protein [Deltaproteobacteria bacterium]
MKNYFIFLIIFMLSGLGHANGFFLYEVSPSSISQGGATIADGSEPSAVFLNTASITRLKGFNFSLNLNIYLSDSEFTGELSKKTTKANTGFFPTPSLFVTYKTHKWISMGLGVYTAYGLGVNWPEKWEGYHLVEHSELQSYSIQPSLALGPFHGFSLGVGFNLVLGAVNFQRGIPFGDGVYAKMRLGGTTTGYGNNVGLFYEPTKWLRMGLHYRSQIVMKLTDGKVDFDDVPLPFTSNLKDQKVKTGLILPQFLGIGMRVAPFHNLELELDVNQIYWSSYKKLTFEFEDKSLNQIQEKKWEDAPQIRLGVQYILKKWILRLGIIYDITPIPDETLDPMLPDNDRIDYCLGIGYSIGKFKIDTSYMFVDVLKRTVGQEKNYFPGSYDAFVHSFALGFSGSL